MNFMQKTLLRQSLKPSITQVEPGTAVLQFAAFRLLPDAARGYTAQAEEAYHLLPGIQTVALDLDQGSIRLTYDPATCSVERIRGWTARIAEAIIDAADLPADAAAERVKARLAQEASAIR